jgi:hypothetical protein
VSNRVETTADLRRVLIDTINGVKSGDISPDAGNSIAKLASTVVQTAKLDLDYLHLKSSSKVIPDDNGTKLIAEKQPIEVNVFDHIQEHGPCTIKRLAEACGVDESSIKEAAHDSEWFLVNGNKVSIATSKG